MTREEATIQSLWCHIESLEETIQQKTKPLGEELRNVWEGITDEKVLIGFNMAIAICNKYLRESGNKDAGSN